MSENFALWHRNVSNEMFWRLPLVSKVIATRNSEVPNLSTFSITMLNNDNNLLNQNKFQFNFWNFFKQNIEAGNVLYSLWNSQN